MVYSIYNSSKKKQDDPQNPFQQTQQAYQNNPNTANYKETQQFTRPMQQTVQQPTAQTFQQQAAQPSVPAITDYSAALKTLMANGSTDADYLQDLLNQRAAKLTDPAYAQYNDPSFTREVQRYIQNVSTPDWEDILAQLETANGPEPAFSSDWMDVADQLGLAAVNMSYDDWTQGDQYQSLRDRYAREGEQAMNDVIAKLAAQTGGLASSYAATAAAQQYNNYMAQLEEVARQMYNAERADAINNANLAKGYTDRDYQMYLNELANYNNKNQFAYGLMSDVLANSKYNQEWQYALDQQAANDRAAEQKDARARLADYLAMGGSLANFDPTLLDATGYTTAELAAMTGQYLGSSGLYSSGGGYSGGDGNDGEPRITNQHSIDRNGILSSVKIGNREYLMSDLPDMLDAGEIDIKLSDDGKKITYVKANK